MPAFYPEGNRSLPSDNEMRSLHKIVDLGGGGSGGGGGGSGSVAQQVYTGAAPPATPTNPAIAALFYPTGSGSVQQWDLVAQAWM